MTLDLHDHSGSVGMLEHHIEVSLVVWTSFLILLRRFLDLPFHPLLCYSILMMCSYSTEAYSLSLILNTLDEQVVFESPIISMVMLGGTPSLMEKFLISSLG